MDHVSGAHAGGHPVRSVAGRAAHARAVDRHHRRFRGDPHSGAPRLVDLPSAALLLVLAALFNALFFVLTRRLADEDAHTTLFYSALVGTVALSLALPCGNVAPIGWRDVALFVLLGVFAGAGHWLVINAYRLAPASLLTPFTYLQIMWATLYGWAIFGQLPDRWSALGMAIVVVSGALLALQERRRALALRASPARS